MDIEITLTYDETKKYKMRVYKADDWGLQRALRWLAGMARKIQAHEVVTAAEKIKDGG